MWCTICNWLKKSHRLEWTTHIRTHRVEARAGLEEQGNRDFDLTIQYNPWWYLTFQLSVWFAYIGGCWSRDPSTYPDCDHDGSECYLCGCPNGCGDKEDDIG